MSFRFGDPGGRIYGTAGTSGANINALWSSIQTPANWSVVAAGSRHDGGTCLRLTHTNSSSCLIKTLDAQATWGCAFAFKTTAVPSINAPLTVVSFQDSGTTQVDLRLTTSNTLQVTRNGTTLATSTNALSTNAWYHIEFKATVHNTAGNYEVRVNGTATGWVPAQGGTANTRATSNNSANAVAVGTFSNNDNAANGVWDLDDLIVYDGQTLDPNGFTDTVGFVGDCGLYWLMPSAAGNTTQWTPDSGVNYARVNEVTPDGDTSYVESSTVNQVDTYQAANLPTGVTSVVTAAALHYARKTDVGSRGIKSVLRSAGADATHAAEIALGNSYLYNWSTWARDPNAGSPAAWTPTAINAVEIGQKVTS